MNTIRTVPTTVRKIFFLASTYVIYLSAKIDKIVFSSGLFIRKERTRYTATPEEMQSVIPVIILKVETL
jgi:hypothetical protein